MSSPIRQPVLIACLCLALGTMSFLSACAPTADDAGSDSSADTGKESNSMTIAANLDERLARYAPTPLAADLSALGEQDRKVLSLLVEAAYMTDEIFLRQVSRDNAALRDQLATLDGPLAETLSAYFDVNFGPWDRLDEDEPFWGTTPKPEGAGYYPDDLTKDEFEAWIEAHPDDLDDFSSTVTTIHRDGDNLKAVAYSDEYREWLIPAAEKLEAAADLTSNASLAQFLRSRAQAFRDDDYYQSDMDWMDLDAPVEVTIGPYETYEDGLLGYKAAFEAYVTVHLPDESAKLDLYKEQLPWLESNLPIPDSMKNPDRGTESPIRVVDVVYSAGDGRAGVQAIAFNLPNDERVREAKGSKKVLLRNTMRAKYDQIMVPIAERVLSPADRDRVSFDAYVGFVLHHELSHGLGPGKLVLDGRETEVRLELAELYSTIEEAKADVMGVYNIFALIDRGVVDRSLLESLEPTYVAGLFRSARFGVHEAHGQGVVAQFNYLREKGAIVIDEEGRYGMVSEAFPGAIEDLLTELLTLQGNGDYDGTKAFLDRYGHPDEDLLAAIEQIDEVAVDVRPIYQPVS